MKRNKAAAGKTPAAAYLFGRVGRMMEDGRYLDEFIRNHRKDKTVLDKLTSEVKRQAQTAEGKLTATLEAAERNAKALQGKGGNDTMTAEKYSVKGENQNEREGKRGNERFEDEKTQDRRGGREVQKTTGDVLRGDTVSRRGRRGVKASFGQKPVRTCRQGDRIGIMTGDIDGDGKPFW